MDKTKIVTAIYFDLYGSDLGGRPGRNDHYLYSLNSIMNIDASFIIYTNDKNKVDNFYKEIYPDKLYKFTSIEYDLRNTQYRDAINSIKNIENTKRSDRCIELQYSKFYWLSLNINNCDKIYWIDAGLCHSGLIPDKYLKINTGKYYDTYYGSDIFNNSWINNLNTISNDKIFVCAKDNVRNYWDSPIPSQYFRKKQNSTYHIIGGLFGGDPYKVKIIAEKFFQLSMIVLEKERFLYSEEQILSCLFYNYSDLFTYETFDTWWHENNINGIIDKSQSYDFLKQNKSFYKIIEKFIS